MMRILTFGDILDVYYKARQRGLRFLFSKINSKSIVRTKSAFSDSASQSSNWWNIPKVRQRWNQMISDNPNMNYKQYLMQEILQKEENLILLSLGSGSCSHELDIAEYAQFKRIICIDIAENRLNEARAKAKERNLHNIEFIHADINKYKLPSDFYDIVMFNSSLHHFDNVEKLLKQKVKPCLKSNGKLIINEFVGPRRLQYEAEQIHSVNQALEFIPNQYKTRFASNAIKSKFYASGLLRMIIADPSECIDSAQILPAIHANFNTIIERSYGGNILMNVLKDISHHFLDENEEKNRILEKLFAFEDEYLREHPSDFVFGIYENSTREIV